MSDDTPRRKAPQTPAPQVLSKRDIALQAIADYRSELAQKYQADLSDWSTRRQAEIERIRKKLGNPSWTPRTPWALETVGPPPENPLALLYWKYPLP